MSAQEHQIVVVCTAAPAPNGTATVTLTLSGVPQTSAQAVIDALNDPVRKAIQKAFCTSRLSSTVKIGPGPRTEQ